MSVAKSLLAISNNVVDCQKFILLTFQTKRAYKTNIEFIKSTQLHLLY